MVYAFLMTKGGQQVLQAKPRARSRAMTNEGGRTDSQSVCEGRNAGTLDCSPKGANFSSTWNQLHVFFEMRREILHVPLCKDDSYVLSLFSKK